MYFSGGKVRNLRSELNRASKLKCSSCSVKGAALGCWITHCRRSYHFPCAKKLPGCAWDEANLIILSVLTFSLDFNLLPLIFFLFFRKNL